MLFKRLGNKKAIGVAYNNLGNTLFGLYRGMKEDKSVFKCSLSVDEVIKKGIKNNTTRFLKGYSCKAAAIKVVKRGNSKVNKIILFFLK